MKKGEKLFRFLASLILREFYGSVTIRFERGNATHVDLKMQRTWEYAELPEGADSTPCEIVQNRRWQHAER